MQRKAKETTKATSRGNYSNFVTHMSQANWGSQQNNVIIWKNINKKRLKDRP